MLSLALPNLYAAKIGCIYLAWGILLIKGGSTIGKAKDNHFVCDSTTVHKALWMVLLCLKIQIQIFNINIHKILFHAVCEVYVPDITL